MSDETTTTMLDPDDAQALWAWAWAELDSDLRRDHAWRSREELVTSLVDVLIFAACELSLSGRHAWVARVPELLKLRRSWQLQEESPQDKCLQAVTTLLHHGAPITKGVQAMVRSRNPRVRAAMADGLRLGDPQSRALLETLTSDADRVVRSIARQRLPPAQPAAWWVGKFDSDPIPRLPEVNDEVLAALRTVALFVDRDSFGQQRDTLPQLVEALALLPTPILAELVRRVVAFDRLAPGYAPMLDELLRRPHGTFVMWDALLARLDQPHEWAHHHFMLRLLSAELSSEAIEQLCQGLLACLIEHRHTARIQDMANMFESVLHDHWPASLPGVLLLDTWERLQGETPELAKSVLPLLHNERVDLRSELARLLSLAERDPTFVRALSSVASRLDAEPRRALVVRGLASQSDEVRSLALSQLCALPFDPTQGSADAVFTRYWSEPSLRRAIKADHRLCEAFCPQLRRRLRVGALDMDETAATIQAIDRLWGETEDDERAARLERVATWHEGATEVGPVTQQEWTIWRTLRRQEIEDDPQTHVPSLFAVRPPGPLHPDDREILDWAMQRWRQTWAAAPNPSDPRGEHYIETIQMHAAMYGIMDPHVLELLEELLTAVRELDRGLARMIEKQMQKLRHTLPD